jgi:hypothetical protein
MGKRDIQHHEAKKPKKNARKVNVAEILEQPPEVEVVKKKRKQEFEEE